MTQTLTKDTIPQVVDAIVRRRYGGIEIKPVHPLDSGLVLGIFAPGGVGKTTVASTIVDSDLGWPALILNCVGNPHVVSSRSDRVDVAEITKFSLIEAIRADIEADPNCQYKTMIYDTVTAMRSLRLRELYGPVGEVTWERQNQSTADILKMLLNAVLLAAGPKKMNAVFTFQEVSEEREIRGAKVRRSEIAANKALQSEIPGIISFLGRLSINEDVRPFTRVLDFTPAEKVHQAKFQTDPNDELMKTVPMMHFNPSLGSILDTYRGRKPWPTEKHRQKLPGS